MTDRETIGSAGERLGLSQEPDPTVGWPISTDGPHEIGRMRHQIARYLLDSKRSDAEAFELVHYHPAIKDVGDGSQPAPSMPSREEVETASLVLGSHLGSLDAAAQPTKSEVFVVCGREAGDLRDAIQIARQALGDPHARG